MQICSTICVSKPYKKDERTVLRQCVVKALWDTGAVISAVSREIADKLGLISIEETVLATSAGQVNTFKDIVLVHLLIDDTFIPVMAAVVDNIPGEDNSFLLGMDVIQCGELTIATDFDNNCFNASFKPYSGLFRRINDVFPKIYV